MGVPSILQPALPISPFSDIVINAQPVVLVATHCDRDRAACRRRWRCQSSTGQQGVRPMLTQSLHQPSKVLRQRRNSLKSKKRKRSLASSVIRHPSEAATSEVGTSLTSHDVS